MTHKGAFRSEDARVDLIQRISAAVVVAVAVGGGEHPRIHAEVGKGGKHLFGVFLCDLINALKMRSKLFLRFFYECLEIHFLFLL